MDGSVRWVYEPRQLSASITSSAEVDRSAASTGGGTLLRMHAPVVGICFERCRGVCGRQVLAKTFWLGLKHNDFTCLSLGTHSPWLLPTVRWRFSTSTVEQHLAPSFYFFKSWNIRG